jgi:tetratricopeptide (TPR) repeat protein
VPRVGGAATFVATLGAVVLAIGVLLALDLFLAGIDRRESSGHAASQYADGNTLLAAGKPADAAEHFSAALAIDRTNVNYALALGEAKRRDGKLDDAETILKTLLERAENDGAVNLAMAQVKVGEGKTGEAKAYFHRAIYGRWGADSVARRAESRFALIDLLVKSGGGRDLLAELLPLEEVSADSIALQRRLGGWFLLAGSPARAANVFREVLRRDPKDAAAYSGMGEAALAQGNFRTARADFAEALALQPDDSLVTVRLALSDTLLTMDPTARGLGTANQYARSRALLEKTANVIAPCVSPAEGALLASARAQLNAATPRHQDEATADRMVTAASDLWSAYAGKCPAVAHETTLPLLFARLAL